MTAPGKCVTQAALRESAGERAFARGAAYFESGAVTDLVVSDETINARVEGSDEYAVQLWADGKALAWSCTCPVGEDGICCKHVVAAGLAWLSEQKSASPAPSRRDDLAGIRGWLAAAPRERLAELLLDQARNDAALRNRLDALAARDSAKQRIDLKSLKETVGRALSVSGFVNYHGMRHVIERASPALDLVAGLIEDGQGAAAYELAHYALKCGIAAYERTDDSGGGFGDLLRQFAGLHLKACRAATPPPERFGKQLFELMLSDQWSLLDFDDYAPLLGEAGLKTYRVHAEKLWRKVPARSPGKDDTRAYTEHFQITHIMERLARREGDVDALIAIKSRDLTNPYRFLEIAEILVNAGRRDEALAWAERGHKAFTKRPDARLVEFLATEYGRRGRHDEAIALAWEEFERHPALNSWKHLKICAKRGKAWDTWRTKALAWIRENLKPPPRDRNRWSWIPAGHSLLVEIFLWEGDRNAALAEARTGGCHEGLWFELAKAHEKHDPPTAAEIYRNHLDSIVQQGNNRAYDEAAELVAKIRELMRRAKQEKEFAAWLEGVRVRHKAKRNFMQRLAR